MANTGGADEDGEAAEGGVSEGGGRGGDVAVDVKRAAAAGEKADAHGARRGRMGALPLSRRDVIRDDMERKIVGGGVEDGGRPGVSVCFWPACCDDARA